MVGFVFPFAWTIARTGCALAHDHIGVASGSWMAVRFPEGPHLDLGLIEALSTACLAACFLLLDRRIWPAPFFFGLTLFGNGLFRLWLNTLHNVPVPSDDLFGWASAAFGCAMLALSWRHRERRRPAAQPAGAGSSMLLVGPRHNFARLWNHGGAADKGSHLRSRRNPTGGKSHRDG